MCDVCRQNPCHSRCPNAPEPTPVYKCICCGQHLYDGDWFYDIDGEPWCEGCIRDCNKIVRED